MFRVTSSGPDPAIQANKKWPDVTLVAASDTILAASDTSFGLTRPIPNPTIAPPAQHPSGLYVQPQPYFVDHLAATG